MAIEILQAQKRQRFMILILTLIICAILLVVWFGFLRGPAAVGPAPSSQVIQPQIEINWNVLQDKNLEALKSFGQIPVLKDKAGRKNPFTSY